MHVGMYDSMRSESESELTKQLKAQLKGVRVISARTRVCVCRYYFANLYYCVCLSASAHRDTKNLIHTQAPTVSRTKKKKKKCIHTHTRSMHVGMYACIRSESESALANQLSDIPRKAKQTNVLLVCLCMSVCMRSEFESASQSSPPQLKGVRVISACACVCVCVLVLFRKYLYCVFLSAGTHRGKKKLQIHKNNTTNTGKCMSSNDRKSTLRSSIGIQYSATRNTHTHFIDESPAKMSAGRADSRLSCK
jgi:hypothetical protein